MLDKIVFITAGEEPINQIMSMKSHLGSKGECIFLCKREEVSTYLKKDVSDQETTLFIADDSFVIDELLRQNLNVVAYLHTGNADQDMTAVTYGITDIEQMDYDALEKAFLRTRQEPWTILETRRCTVRETTVQDVDAFYIMYAEPSITCYMEKLYEEPEQEREYAREYIDQVYSFYGYGMWSIIDKKTTEVIGRAGISWREGFEYPELGFVIAVPYQGQGIAYEVCSAILAYAQMELDLSKIQALVRKENTASAALCRKLGFYDAGIVHEKGNDYILYYCGRSEETV